MLNFIPAALWLTLVALNFFMFFLNMALEQPSYMALNLISGSACYLCYMLTTKTLGGDDNE